MPTYTFKFKDTGETWQQVCSIAVMEAMLARCPTLDVIPGAPLIHSGRGLGKPDSGFRDLLHSIKKAHRGSSINDFGGGSEV